MIADFSDVLVYWFDPERAEKSRVWNGVLDGKPSARVGQGDVSRYVTGFLFPPLGGVRSKWALNTLFSPIDELYSLPPSTIEVIGREENLLQLRHKKLEKLQTGAIGGFETVDIVDFWVDMEMGQIPKKASWYSYILRDGAPLAEKTPLPFKTLEVTKVIKTGEAYYPASGVVQSFVGISKTSITLDEYLRGKRIEIDFLPQTKLTWQCEVSRGDDALQGEFENDFPSGTNYFDEIKNKVMIVGLSELDVDRLLEANQAAMPPKSSTSRLYFSLTAGFLLLLTYLVLWRRGRPLMVLLLFACICSSAKAQQIPEKISGGQFEHCGVSCIYGIVKANGKQAKISSIVDRIAELFPMANLQKLTLEEVRDTIRSFGIAAEIVKTDTSALRSMRLPLVLYLRADNVGDDQGVGHVILLQSINDRSAALSDFTAGIGNFQVSISQLDSFWNGECIVVGRSSWYAAIFQSLHVELALIVMLIGLSGFLLRSRPNWRRIARLTVLMVFFVGCGRNSETRIVLVQPEFDLGYVTTDRFGNGISYFDIPIQAWSKSDVSIDAVRGSCLCTSLDQSIIGKSLPAGSKAIIPARLNMSGRLGEVRTFVTIESGGKHYSTNLKCFVLRAPTAIPPVVAFKFSGTGSAEADLEIASMRTTDGRIAKVDLQKSILSTVKLKGLKEDSVKEGAAMQDRTLLRLELEHGDASSVEKELKIVFCDDVTEPISVPVEVEFEQTIRLDDDYVFLGKVPLKATRQVILRFQGNDLDRLRV